MFVFKVWNGLALLCLPDLSVANSELILSSLIPLLDVFTAAAAFKLLITLLTC